MKWEEDIGGGTEVCTVQLCAALPDACYGKKKKCCKKYKKDKRCKDCPKA